MRATLSGMAGSRAKAITIVALKHSFLVVLAIFAAAIGACTRKPEQSVETLRQALVQQAGELGACEEALRQACGKHNHRADDYEALMQELVRTKVERDQLQQELRARRRQPGQLPIEP